MLVTGATGYLGRRVAALLAQKGVDADLASRQSKPASHSSPQRWHHVDLLEPGAPEHLIAAVRPRLLLHLAWDVTPGYWTSPANARWRDATGALARAFFARGGSRFVGAGTCAEYDWSDGVCDETRTAIAPASPYGQAKTEAWRLVQDAAATSGQHAAWARVFYLFGGTDEPPSRLVPAIVNAIRAGAPAECSPGDQRRDFLHVDDVASAFVALALGGVTGAVNLGSGEAHAVREVIEGIARRMGRPDLVRLGARPADPVPSVAATVRRLTDEVGWRPARTFEQALDRAVSPSSGPDPTAETSRESST